MSKHNQAAPFAHNVDYTNLQKASLYFLVSDRNTNLRIIRDYLELFQNRSADFTEVKLLMKKNGLKDYFGLFRHDDFSYNSISVVRYDGLDLIDLVFSSDDRFVSEICRVFLSRVKAHLINDWKLSEIKVFGRSGVSFHHDFLADGRQG